MKYKLTENTKVVDNIKLFQIQRISDGKLGGWIQSESNLSQEGSAWVYGNALVFDNAKVYSDAQAYDNACVVRTTETKTDKQYTRFIALLDEI